MKYSLEINKKNFDVTISGISENMARVLVNGQPYEVRIGNPPGTSASPQVPAQPFTAQSQKTAVPGPIKVQKTQASPLPAGQGEPVLAPIPGLILEIRVKVGQTVNAGQIVAILEAMKMENSLVTPVSGTVKEIRVEKGAQVSTGDVILVVG